MTSHPLVVARHGARRPATRPRPSIASGGPSACSRTAARPSSSPPIRCSSTRCATSSASIWRRPTAPWCCAWTRRARSRRSIGPSRCCRCGPGQPERRSHDYQRHGTTLAVRRARRGDRQGDRPLLTSATAPSEFLNFLRAVDAEVPRRSRRPSGDGQLRHATRPRRSAPGSPGGVAHKPIWSILLEIMINTGPFFVGTVSIVITWPLSAPPKRFSLITKLRGNGHQPQTVEVNIL